MIKKACVRVGSLALAFTALMGFAHTSAGRPLLTVIAPFMGMSAACPLGYDHLASLQDRENARKAFARRMQGKPLMARKQALDFTIGKTGRAAAFKWAAAQGGACRKLRSPYESECKGPFFGSDSSTLWLEFDSRENLVSMRGIENYSTPQEARKLYVRLKSEIRSATLMIPDAQVKSQGSGDPKKALFSQDSISAEFGNYLASARVTNLGSQFAVTQDFLGY
jgi:hypothetical protein